MNNLIMEDQKEQGISSNKRILEIKNKYLIVSQARPSLPCSSPFSIMVRDAEHEIYRSFLKKIYQNGRRKDAPTPGVSPGKLNKQINRNYNIKKVIFPYRIKFFN